MAKTAKQLKQEIDIKKRAKKTAPQALVAFLTWELVFSIIQAIMPAVNDWIENDGTWAGLQIILPALGTAAFAAIFSYVQNKYRASKGIDL